MSDGIFMAHVATVEGKCLSQTPLLVYMPLAFRVISVVLWWNEARQLVYMALVVSYASVGVGRLVISGNMSVLWLMTLR